jgi:hypothetical protein
MIEQLKISEALQKIVNNHDGEQKTLGPVVGALRLKSDIYDRIIEKGQEFGVIQKAVEKKENVHFIAELSSDDLREAIKEQWRKLARTSARTGNQSILELPAPDKIHYGESVDVPTKKDFDDEDDEDVTYTKPKKKKKKKKKKARKIED